MCLNRTRCSAKAALYIYIDYDIVNTCTVRHCSSARPASIHDIKHWKRIDNYPKEGMTLHSKFHVENTVSSLAESSKKKNMRQRPNLKL